MRVVICEPGKRAEIRDIDGRYETMCRLVGGDLDRTYPYTEPGITFIGCEEGVLKGLKPNRILHGADRYDEPAFVGTFVICGTDFDDDGEPCFGSLTEKQAEKYRKLLEMPEDFFVVGDTILGVPYDPDYREEVTVCQ